MFYGQPDVNREAEDNGVGVSSVPAPKKEDALKAVLPGKAENVDVENADKVVNTHVVSSTLASSEKAYFDGGIEGKRKILKEAGYRMIGVFEGEKGYIKAMSMVKNPAHDMQLLFLTPPRDDRTDKFEVWVQGEEGKILAQQAELRGKFLSILEKRRGPVEKKK